MNGLTITTVALLGWLFAAPAISADFSSTPDVKPASQSAQQYFSTAASQPASHPAVKELIAGMAERERALDLAARLDELDYEELAIWEQIIPALPIVVLTADAREQENAMRLGALPLLSARQKQYRALELELGRSLLAAISSTYDEASVGRQVARLASMREWSNLVEQAQRQTRTTLDSVHVVALVRATKAGVRLDAAALVALKQIRERRSALEVAYAEATTAWEVSRDESWLDRMQQDLGVAASMARAAADNERNSEDLRKRAAEATLPASLRELLRVTAEVLDATARVGGRWAANQVGIVDWRAESFLAEPRKVDGADTELTALLAERRRLATALRASLATRVATLVELKSLVQQRENVLAGASYLTPTEDQRRAYATAQQPTANAWRQVGELRGLAGDIASAEVGERALAAELLGAKLEELVLLEEQLNTLAIGRLLDPIPRPADTRLAAAATRWKQDVDALQAIDGKWTTWRKAWDERGKREEGDFAALRALVVRTNDLRVARIAILARAFPQAATDDDISRLAMGMVSDAGAQTQVLPDIERELRRVREEGEADPVVGAIFKLAGELRWSNASAGLRELPRLFHQVARQREARNLMPVALNPALPAAQRLGALMSLSEALGMPWLAFGSGQELRVATELAGETYLLEGLAQNAPQLRREREFFVGAPMQFAAVSMSGLQLAQARAPSGQPHAIELGPATKGVLRAVAQAYTDVRQNLRVYALMPVAGGVVGGCLGACLGPAGAWAGAVAGVKYGGVAIVAAAGQDAIAGGYKVAIKGATAEIRRALPADYVRSRDFLARSQQYTERGVDIGQAGAAVISSGLRFLTGGGTDKLRKLEGLRVELVEGRQTLKGLSRQARELATQLRGPLSADVRRNLTRTLENVREAEKNVTKILQGARAEENILTSQVVKQGLRHGMLSTAAADQLADSNDMSFGGLATRLGEPDEDDRVKEARDWLEKTVTSLLQSVTASPDRPVANNQTADDPQRDLALQGYGGRQAQRAGQSPQSAAAVVTRGSRPSSDTLLESVATLQQELEMEAWEDKRNREISRLIQEKEKEKEKKDKDAATVQDEIKKPVKPDTPDVETDPPILETKGWYGFDAVISYKFKGASCTQTVSGEVFGTRDDAEQALRDETAKAMRADASNRSDVMPVRQEIYAGPLTFRPTYPGPTGLKAVQCGSVTTVTPQIRQWYVLEAVISFTTKAEVIGKTTAILYWGSKKMDCTGTSWSARQLLPSELPEALRIAGEQLAQPRSIWPSGARVVSTRVYQGPSATQLKTPAYKQECGKPY